MRRLCTAHSKRDGKPCRGLAVSGSAVCRHHGAKGRGPGPRVTGPAREASVAALARRRLDKLAGLPVSPMGGARRKGQKNPIKAKFLIAQQIAAIPVVDKPFEKM